MNATIDKIFKIAMLVISTGIGAAVINFWIEWKTDEAIEESQQFDGPAQKHKVLFHVDEAPTPKQLQEAYLRDSLNTVSAIKSRRVRDSLALIKDHRDSLTAVTIFLLKEQVKGLNEKVNHIH